MEVKKYPTSKKVAIILTLVGAFGYGIAIFGNPDGFQLNFVTVLLFAILIFIFFDSLYGTHVLVENGFLSRTDNFIFKKKIPIPEIEAIRYQPTYGVGKEVSSLYIFKKGDDTAVVTMTSIWFTEKVLGNLLHDLVRRNPTIKLDEEAEVLLKKHDSSV